MKNQQKTNKETEQNEKQAHTCMCGREGGCCGMGRELTPEEFDEMLGLNKEKKNND